MIDKTAILLTAHPKQQKWWDSVLLSLDNYPGPMVLSYDDVDLTMIPSYILGQFNDYICTGYPAGKLLHARGELVCIRNGLRLINRLGNIDYVLKLGFDEPLWRWRNIAKLIDIIKNPKIDVIDNFTRLIFGPPDLLLKMFELHDVENPDAVPKKPAEAHYRGICKQLNIRRQVITDHEYWRKLLGVTHLQGEYAANVGKDNKYSWSIGELWPRQ